MVQCGLVFSMTPENSTPRIGPACGGTGYRPSLCDKSILFNPNAFTLTRTWPSNRQHHETRNSAIGGRWDLSGPVYRLVR